MERDRKGNVYRKLFVGFFLFMLVCTVISRIYDSVSVPKVVTEASKRRPVTTEIRGTGTVRENQTVFADVAAGLKVESIAVIPGSVVKAGDPLFVYQLESLLEKKEESERELERLRLDLESQKVSAEVYPEVSQRELAAFEVQMAERELSEGEVSYASAVADHDAALEQLIKDYERKTEMTEEELWEQQNEQYESVRRALSQARRSRDSEIRSATRKVDSLEKELEKLLEEGNHQAEAEELEREIEQARGDLDDLIDSWDEQIEDTESELDMIDNRRGRIESGKTSSLDALKEAYDADVKQQEDLLKSAEKELKSAQKALERARFGARNAAVSDENTRLTNEQKRRLADLKQQSLQLDIEEKKRELARLEELWGAEGVVSAGADGTVVKQELLAGKKTGGEELVSVAVGELIFEGSFLKDEQELAVGDVLRITIPGTSRKMEGKVNRLNLLGEKGVFQADIGELAGALGAVTDYECEKQSDTFNQVIPIGGLRKDIKGYYCLVARPRSSILGEEFIAERVDVQLLHEGTSDAAVEGSLFEEDKVIVKSSQVIGEGDRVRIVEEL